MLKNCKRNIKIRNRRLEFSIFSRFPPCEKTKRILPILVFRSATSSRSAIPSEVHSTPFAPYIYKRSRLLLFFFVFYSSPFQLRARLLRATTEISSSSINITINFTINKQMIDKYNHIGDNLMMEILYALFSDLSRLILFSELSRRLFFHEINISAT